MNQKRTYTGDVMLNKILSLTVTIGLCYYAIQISQAQIVGFGSGEGLPEFEIYPPDGDLYRYRSQRHFGMFLVTPEGIILVEPTNSRAAAWLREQLDERFPELPVRYVIYSHAHNDHATGGEAFADTAIFIGHENMRKNLTRPAENASLLPREQLWDINKDGLIQETEAEGTALANNFSLADEDGNRGLNRAEIWNRQFGGSQIPPDIYYSDYAKITLGGKTVELHYTGKNHTDDMTVVRFPEERTIYTVDFLTPKRPPRTQLQLIHVDTFLRGRQAHQDHSTHPVSFCHLSLSPHKAQQ